MQGFSNITAPAESPTLTGRNGDGAGNTTNVTGSSNITIVTGASSTTNELCPADLPANRRCPSSGRMCLESKGLYEVTFCRCIQLL